MGPCGERDSSLLESHLPGIRQEVVLVKAVITPCPGAECVPGLGWGEHPHFLDLLGSES